MVVGRAWRIDRWLGAALLECLTELYHFVLFFRVGHVFAAAPALSVYGWLYGFLFLFWALCCLAQQRSQTVLYL